MAHGFVVPVKNRRLSSYGILAVNLLSAHFFVMIIIRSRIFSETTCKIIYNMLY